MARRAKPPADPLARRLAEGLGRLCTVLRSQAWAAHKHSGLSPTQLQILRCADRRGPAPVTLSEVAAELQVAVATASVAVATLVRKELLRKTTSARDRRARSLVLTTQGRALLRAGEAAPAALAETIGDLERETQEALLHSLMALLRGLEAHGALPVARLCVACSHFQPHRHAGARPHHCTFLNQPLGAADLQLDCPAHRHADAERRNATWQQVQRPAPRS